MNDVVTIAVGETRYFFDGAFLQEIHGVRSTGLGRAMLGVIEMSDDMRRYCEYLEAHGFKGDAYKRFKRSAPHMRGKWAMDAYHKYVTDDLDLLAYLREADTETEAEV